MTESLSCRNAGGVILNGNAKENAESIILSAFLARRKEFESPTFRLGGGRSILLSYRRIFNIDVRGVCSFIVLVLANVPVHSCYSVLNVRKCSVPSDRRTANTVHTTKVLYF